MTEKETKDLKEIEINASEISEELINPTYTNIDVIEDYPLEDLIKMWQIIKN